MQSVRVTFRFINPLIEGEAYYTTVVSFDLGRGLAVSANPPGCGGNCVYPSGQAPSALFLPREPKWENIVRKGTIMSLTQARSSSSSDPGIFGTKKRFQETVTSQDLIGSVK